MKSIKVEMDLSEWRLVEYLAAQWLNECEMQCKDEKVFKGYRAALQKLNSQIEDPAQNED
jgi:hypothetical protein